MHGMSHSAPLAAHKQPPAPPVLPALHLLCGRNDELLGPFQCGVHIAEAPSPDGSIVLRALRRAAIARDEVSHRDSDSEIAWRASAS